MTDEELIAALGWQPCHEWTRIANPMSSVGWRCDTHRSGIYVGDRSPEMCFTLRVRVEAARAGIDLARTGIGATLRADADRIDQEAKGSDAPGPLMVAATHQRRSAAMVEGWQP